MGRRRVILATAGVAAVSLALGVAVAGRVTSPQEAAARAEAPRAGVITAPVELRVVSNEVVTRGDVVYDGAADVSVSTAGLATSPVVTGQVPRVGDTIDAGQVVLQMVGRPVIALPGTVPTYRSLSPGLAGPDVLQLETALAGLGLDPGAPADDQYDQRTAAAVAQLYGRVGYAPPVADEQLLDDLDMAREQQTAAEDEVLAASQGLDAAFAPRPESERIAAEAAVVSAQNALTAAQAEGDAAAVAEAQAQLAIATAQRDEVLAPPNPMGEQAAFAQAQSRLTEARAEVADLEVRTATPLPAAEVVFLSGLPRRIDAVMVGSGTSITGPVLRVSGTDVVVVASLGSVDAELVTADLPAKIDIGNETIDGTVVAIRDAPAPPDAPGEEGDGGGPTPNRKEAVIRPAALTPEQVAALLGENVRVTIPVQATTGEVLAVPLAALSAGPGGETRVEVRREGGRIARVEVEVGLSAGGYAEVRPDTAPLEPGDAVVVGR